MLMKKQIKLREDIGSVNMQVVYQGTNVKVDYPKIILGKFTKDFGNGFYCTILKEQAIRWAKKYDTSIVNIYEYKENSNLKIKEFNLINVMSSWIIKYIDNYNSSMYYENPSYIYNCYIEGKIL